MTQSTEQERAEFIKWANDALEANTEECLLFENEFTDPLTNSAWWAWQASAARRAQVVPQEVIDRVVPALDPEWIDPEVHHCEWALYKDRERIRRELAAAPQQPEVNARPHSLIGYCNRGLTGVILSPQTN